MYICGGLGAAEGPKSSVISFLIVFLLEDDISKAYANALMPPFPVTITPSPLVAISVLLPAPPPQLWYAIGGFDIDVTKLFVPTS